MTTTSPDNWVRRDLCGLRWFVPLRWAPLVLAALLLAALRWGVVRLWRKVPFLPTGWFWFVGMLIPVIGLLQVGEQSMADRYTYVPLIGVALALAWGLAELVPAGSDRRHGLAACAGIAIVLCSLLTARQVEFWRDSETLFHRRGHQE